MNEYANERKREKENPKPRRLYEFSISTLNIRIKLVALTEARCPTKMKEWLKASRRMRRRTKKKISERKLTVVVQWKCISSQKVVMFIRRGEKKTSIAIQYALADQLSNTRRKDKAG